jgi:hypothetical protein
MSLEALNYLKQHSPQEQEQIIASWGGDAATANQWYQNAQKAHGAAPVAPNTQASYAQGRDADLDAKIKDWQTNIDSRYDAGAWAAWAPHADPSCPPSHPFRPDPEHMKGMGVDPSAASQHWVEKPVDVPHALKGTGYDRFGGGAGGGPDGKGGWQPDPRGEALAMMGDPLQQQLLRQGLGQGGVFREHDMDPNQAGRQGYEKLFSLSGGGIFMQGSGEPKEGMFVNPAQPAAPPPARPNRPVMSTPTGNEIQPQTQNPMGTAAAPANPAANQESGRPIAQATKPPPSTVPQYKRRQMTEFNPNAWWSR